jgi:hypothetical protein
VRPYYEAGLSFDHLTNVTQSSTVAQTSHAGLVLGAGLDIKVPRVRLSPELRYTRQFSSDFRGISQLNQAEVLLGIRF